MTDLEANTGKSFFLFGILYFFIHPGFMAVKLHRIAHALYKLGLPGKVFGKIIWRLNVLFTSCYIHPLAKIGSGLRLPHATAIVIGHYVTIGENVTLYQNVTLGQRSPDQEEGPTIENDVIVFTNASVLGPVTIGQNVVIGAHSLVFMDVTMGQTITGTHK